MMKPISEIARTLLCIMVKNNHKDFIQVDMDRYQAMLQIFSVHNVNISEVCKELEKYKYINTVKRDELPVANWELTDNAIRETKEFLKQNEWGKLTPVQLSLLPFMRSYATARTLSKFIGRTDNAEENEQLILDLRRLYLEGQLDIAISPSGQFIFTKIK